MSNLYYQDERITLHRGACLDVLPTMPAASVDAVITDPPYGLGFMGHEWDQPGAHGSLRGNGRPLRGRRETSFDHHTSTLRDGAMEAGRYDLSRSANARFGDWCEAWARECLRVLKPGGYLLSFGGSRTWHRLQCAVEDAGFEIRDSIAWLYGSGFPKSLNIGDGRGTALKPAFEPIVVGRKPLAGTVAANVLIHGTGALNIDACRTAGEPVHTTRNTALGAMNDDGWQPKPGVFESHAAGRWPTNVVLDDTQAAALDEQTGVLTSGASSGHRNEDKFSNTYRRFKGTTAETPREASSGGASRFFPVFRYEAKAPDRERPRLADGTAHPTVKPLDLMRWLVRLVTPPGGTVLDLFAGSGTTGEACVIEGFDCILIERHEPYAQLIVERLSKPIQTDMFGGVA